MPALTLVAPAKLNLYLHVLGKREDGYHDLESLVVFTEFADRLTVEPAEDLSLVVEGEFAEASGAAENNLVLKAARALQSKLPQRPGAKITLTKHIPVGAGLGGGSADAAATLRGLNRFWGMDLSYRDLLWMAGTLGADVPMCIASTPAIARGTGTELVPFLTHWPRISLLLVHPRVALLSKDVYGALELPKDARPSAEIPLHHPAILLDSLKSTRNDLQRAAIVREAKVAQVLLALETLQPAPSLVRMSGSGACCFAIYTDHTVANKAADSIARNHPDWWVKVTELKRD